MPLVADSTGVVQGKFLIPAGVRAGSKLVKFEGAGGSKGSATFVGQGTLITETRQQVTTVTVSQPPMRIDPLAQTFSLQSAEQLAAAEIYIIAKFDSPILVQIRETQVGLPTQTVLAEARLKPSEITVNAWNRFTFQAPVSLLANVEYALVVLCNDAVSSIAVAELGKYDTANSRWVTSQPYQVGVLLSSSNASTWTAHQDRDMTFRLLAARYTQSERVVDLGTVAVTGATDLIVLANMENPTTQASSDIQLTLPDSTVITTGEGQVVRLPSATTGNIGVKARLRSQANASAVITSGTQIVAGACQTTAEYITRAIPADAAGCTVSIIIDANLPSGSGVTVQICGTDAGDTWQAVTQDGVATAIGDGYFEYKFKKTAVTEAAVRVKLILNGSASARPLIKNLRVSTF